MATKNNTYISSSPIHGKGLFARLDISRGERIGTFKGSKAKRNSKHTLWVYDENNNVIGRHGKNNLRFLNHSAKPNAEFDGFELYALRKIRPNEEIVIHYGWQ
ncbi:MAG: SET domain-containing protein [Gammaproteobacteria bacterium]|nr:SET domain-containing protein [Gammaproteobacteria bacterium]